MASRDRTGQPLTQGVAAATASGAISGAAMAAGAGLIKKAVSVVRAPAIATPRPVVPRPSAQIARPTARPVAERLFTSPRVGVGSRTLGNSFARGTEGSLNVSRRIVKVGWSNTARRGGGMQLRVGVGRIPNTRHARVPVRIPGTFVPNARANPIMLTMRAARGIR